MNTQQIAADRFGTERHRSIDPRSNCNRRSFLEIAAEAGRNLDGRFDISTPQPPLEIGIVDDRRPLDEIAGTSELAEIGAALGRLIAIKGREREIVDIRRDAESEDQHEECGAEQSEREPDRIAQEFQRLTRAVSKDPAKAEDGGAVGPSSNRGGALCAIDADGLDARPGGRRRGGAVRLFEIADEGIFEGCGSAHFGQCRRRVSCEHPALIHQGNPVAARRFIHEMRRDENGDVMIARQVDQQFPKTVPCERIDP